MSKPIIRIPVDLRLAMAQVVVKETTSCVNRPASRSPECEWRLMRPDIVGRHGCDRSLPLHRLAGGELQPHRRWSGVLPRRQLVYLPPHDTDVTTRLTMTPQSAIAGKVVDENGWPVSGALLTIAQYVTDSGVRQLQALRRVRSDDRGEYRVGKLAPGRYYLRIRPEPWGDYLPAWYPSAAEITEARAIDLQEGQELSGADVQLARGGGIEVSGHVSVPAGFQTAQALTFAWEELGSTTIPGDVVPIRPDGGFTVRHVAPASTA